jgi:hypothetical protein
VYARRCEVGLKSLNLTNIYDSIHNKNTKNNKNKAKTKPFGHYEAKSRVKIWLAFLKRIVITINPFLQNGRYFGFNKGCTVWVGRRREWLLTKKATTTRSCVCEKNGSTKVGVTIISLYNSILLFERSKVSYKACNFAYIQVSQLSPIIKYHANFKCQ